MLYLSDFVLLAKIFNNFWKLPYKDDPFPKSVVFEDFGKLLFKHSPNKLKTQFPLKFYVS